MKVQSIMPAVNFNARKRNPNVDRAVTVQDLYELEDRMKDYNKKLVNSQTQMLGNALYNTNKLIYSASFDSNSNIRQALLNAIDASQDLRYIRNK